MNLQQQRILEILQEGERTVFSLRCRYNILYTRITANEMLETLATMTNKKLIKVEKNNNDILIASTTANGTRYLTACSDLLPAEKDVRRV